VIFKLIVHPVNDPPVVEAIGDTNLFMNNEFYPNDINIRIETSDVEEIDNSDIHLVDVQVVDGESGTVGNYCEKVQQAVNLITDNGNQIDAPQTLNGQTVLPADLVGDVKCNEMIYCTTICYEPFGMSRENAEELCGFANYDTSIITDDDGNITTDNSRFIGDGDVIACNTDVRTTT
jgi:hypothetical protein